MCFSATASFISSAVLVTTGAVAMHRARKTPYYLLALIPLLFGIQQFSEGFVWLSLQQEQFTRYLQISAIGFVFFAWVIWPMYVPIAIRYLEPKVNKRKGMNYLVVVGLLLSGVLFYGLFWVGVAPEITGHSISYKIPVSKLAINILSVVYLVCTIVPQVISSQKRVWVLGFSTLVLFVIAKIFFAHALLSVWCMFCAISSLLVLYVIPRNATV